MHAAVGELTVPPRMLEPVTRWRVVYRGKAPELVDADECRREGARVVLVAWRVVVMEPRAVVVRRLRAADVDRVERVG